MSRTLVVAFVVAAVALVAGFAGGLAFSLRPFAAPTATPSLTATATDTASPLPTATATIPPSATPSATPAPTDTPTSSETPTGPPTATLRPSRTPSITPTPTFAPPEGRVLEQANCRYGPGAAYLYEWGLYPKNHVDILATNQLGDWWYVHPWYFRGDCWVRADLIEVLHGDMTALRPFYGLLPFSELYKPPRVVSAVRNADEVTISWSPVWMTEDDYRGYLIEAWLCVGGQLVFTPIAVDGTVYTVHDEAGCLQPSSARVYTAEKHGYTEWRLVKWPLHPGSTPTPDATPSS
jgi:hypothetical protein